MSRNIIFVLMYHRHKLLDLIYQDFMKIRLAVHEFFHAYRRMGNAVLIGTL
jgi:hypothetical protein